MSMGISFSHWPRLTRGSLTCVMSDNTINYHEYVQVLGLEDVFDSKRAINEAFYFAKNSSPVSYYIINSRMSPPDNSNTG